MKYLKPLDYLHHFLQKDQLRSPKIRLTNRKRIPKNKSKSSSIKEVLALGMKFLRVLGIKLVKD